MVFRFLILTLKMVIWFFVLKPINVIFLLELQTNYGLSRDTQTHNVFVSILWLTRGTDTSRGPFILCLSACVARSSLVIWILINIPCDHLHFNVFGRLMLFVTGLGWRYLKVIIYSESVLKFLEFRERVFLIFISSNVYFTHLRTVYSQKYVKTVKKSLQCGKGIGNIF